MFKIIVPFLLLAVAGCQTTQQSAPPPVEKLEPLELNKQQTAAVHAGASKKLKDPDSAKFSRLSAGQSDPKTIHICGYVNARNSFGGFTGDKPFIGLLFKKPEGWLFVPISYGGSERDTRVVSTLCRKYGLF